MAGHGCFIAITITSRGRKKVWSRAEPSRGGRQADRQATRRVVFVLLYD